MDCSAQSWSLSKVIHDYCGCENKVIFYSCLFILLAPDVTDYCV